jgi:hypothetical protein
MNGRGAVFQPELIELMKAVLDDAAMMLPEAKRTSAMKAEIASHILACAAKGERDPVVLQMKAVLAVVECSHYSHEISPERQAVWAATIPLRQRAFVILNPRQDCHLVPAGWCCRSRHKERSMRKARLDNRHRNHNGEISHKHGNTLIRALRKIYGQSLLPVILIPRNWAMFSLNSTKHRCRRDYETGHLQHKIENASK